MLQPPTFNGLILPEDLYEIKITPSVLERLLFIFLEIGRALVFILEGMKIC